MPDEASAKNARPWTLGPDDPTSSQMEPPKKACPFCGAADIFFFEYTYSKEFAVVCRRCGGQGPRRRSPGKARQLWDTRRVS